MVAALFVAAGGCYFGLPDVDPWPESRDARLYAGPWPVVAHPPCARWCRLAGLVASLGGPAVGDDGGTFASALESVRRWGGVLEHPAETKAWKAHGLQRPQGKGWWAAGDGVGYCCRVEQRWYGHLARKATWLYAAVPPERLPQLEWGKGPPPLAWVTNDRRRRRGFRELGKHARLATPAPFRDVLLGIARSCRP